MLRATLSLWVIICFASITNGQSVGIQTTLESIERNNPQLLAYQSLVTGRSMELKANNGLDDFQVAGYYMPFGDHIGPDYYEVEVAQSFDFPSVYSARKNLANLQQDELTLAYDQQRQDILLPAKQLCLELIYLNKRFSVVVDRVRRANQIMEQTHQRYDSGKVKLVDLNKSKIAWLQLKYSLDQLMSERTAVQSKLEKLNGGQSIALEDTSYAIGTRLPTFDALWETYQSLDPGLLALAQQELIAAQELTVVKRSTLPGITAGYNAQGFRGEYYAGILAGVSLPLWKSSAKVNAAKALTDYQHLQSSAFIQDARSELLESYYRYELLQSGLEEYRETFQDIGDEQFLKQAYDADQLSFIEFAQEVEFYWEAYDTMMAMERDLEQIKAALTKHEL